MSIRIGRRRIGAGSHDTLYSADCGEAMARMVEWLLVAGIGILLLIVSCLPLHWRFRLALLLSVPQVYTLSIEEVYPSLALICAISLWTEFVKYGRTLVRWKPVAAILGVLVMHVISFLWSSDLKLGLRTVVFMLPFLTTLAGAYALAKRRPEEVYRVLSWTLSLVVLQAILVVIFRVNAEAERAFWESRVASIFINPNAVAAFLDGSERNNVVDLNKAGGLFLNANVAAGYMGVAAVLSWSIARLRRSPTLAATSFILMGGVLCTGSKMGAILCVSLPFLGLLITASIRGTRARSVFAVLASVLLIVTSFAALYEPVDAYASVTGMSVNGIFHTTNVRLKIWSYAAQALEESPILGQGFGGWQERFPRYALRQGIPSTYPPHNTLIYLWSQSGILSVILAILFMVSVVLFALRRIMSTSEELRSLGLGVLLSATWIFLHGMGENWGLVGEERQQVIWAAALGLCLSRSRFAGEKR